MAADYRITQRVSQIAQLVEARRRESEPVETPRFPKKRYRCLPALAQGFDATS